MRNWKALLLMAVACVLQSCGQPSPQEEDSRVEQMTEAILDGIRVGDVEVVMIDGCEYLVYMHAEGANKGFGFMAHKGNCVNPIHAYRSHGGAVAPPKAKKSGK